MLIEYLRKCQVDSYGCHGLKTLLCLYSMSVLLVGRKKQVNSPSCVTTSFPILFHLAAIRNSTLERSMQETKDMADLRELSEDHREQRKDKRKAVEAAENRELKKMDLAGELQLRVDERAADYVDKDRREYSRNREKRKERAHDLAMMQMQLQISDSSRKQGHIL